MVSQLRRVLFLCCIIGSAVQPSSAAPPNILFIMADDLRPELASYGSPAITPSLDRLARQGVQFNGAYCQQSVCNPSRSSLLTGLRPDTLHVWSNGRHFREPNPDVTTIPLWFKSHGYVSRCCGKIFHNWHTQVHGDPQSWSAPEFLHYANHGNDVPTLTGELPPNLATANTRKYGAVPLSECRDVPDEAYYDGRVAAEAVRVLKEIKSQPFFLAVGFWKPHAPFNPPKKYWDLYDREKLPALNPARPQGAPDIAFHDSREIVGAPPKTVTFTPEQTAENRHGYFAAISYMDAQIGKVLDALASEGLADKTVVVFVADHGYHIGEHGLWGKTSNFEYDAHVPLLISVPGSKQSGQQTDSLVELVDLFPTLVELCGLPKPAKLDGASLVPILNDAKTQVKTAAFSQFPRPAYYDREPTAQPESMGYSVRTPDARYTEWRDWQTGRLLASELYEHPRDEAELTNRAAAPTDAGVAQAAQAALHAEFPPSRAPSQR